MGIEFKNGEKIRVYSDSGAFYGEVHGPYGDIKSALIDVYMPNGKIGSFYKKQCRRLVPKKRKELTRKMIAEATEKYVDPFEYADIVTKLESRLGRKIK